VKPRPSRIGYKGRDVAALPPNAIARLGFGFVPQERGIFPSLTVRENLTVFARSGRQSPFLRAVSEQLEHATTTMWIENVLAGATESVGPGEASMAQPDWVGRHGSIKPEGRAR
jgi:ABC-type branched-subunit amino acid transport system ATPase component